MECVLYSWVTGACKGTVHAVVVASSLRIRDNAGATFPPSPDTRNSKQTDV